MGLLCYLNRSVKILDVLVNFISFFPGAPGQSVYAPKITTSPTSLTVREHKSASFQCKAEGLPTPVIEWTRTGGLLTSDRRVIQSDNSLLLTNVTYADHGTYTCSAVSVLGNVSASAYLTVQGECLLLNA